MPSEKCVGGWGSDNDEMRMITASFARAIERFAGDLCLHFLPLFQQAVAIRKTCNQLRETSTRFATPSLCTFLKLGEVSCMLPITWDIGISATPACMHRSRTR